MRVAIVAVLCLGIVLQLGGGNANMPSRMYFAKDLFKVIARDRYNENVIFSPVSIESCLTLAYIGADGQTADEIRNGLKLETDDKMRIAKAHNEFVSKEFKREGGGPILKMANRIYVNDGLSLAPTFNDVALKYFDSLAEQVHFADAETTVNKINQWVEQNTNNKIKNLLQPSAVDADTTAVLVNAIYFKGKWELPFSTTSTRPNFFFLSDGGQITIDMMYQDGTFKYGEVPELDATVLELPYENSDMSMFFILPKRVNGLRETEQKFATMNLHEIPQRLRAQPVDIYIPKFRIEFEIHLKDSLQQLGMKTMFTNAADLSNLFTSKVPQKVDDVTHKAYIDVNEAGSEAAAATYLKPSFTSAVLNPTIFRADHPFMFAIRNNHGVYFAGHVTKF